MLYMTPFFLGVEIFKVHESESNLKFIPTVGLLVSCFGFYGSLRQYFSLYRAVSLREGKRGEKR